MANVMITNRAEELKARKKYLEEEIKTLSSPLHSMPKLIEYSSSSSSETSSGSESTDDIDSKEDSTTVTTADQPILINDDLPCHSKESINTTTNDQTRLIARGKYSKRKLDCIIEGVRQNVKHSKEDQIQETLKRLVTHMENMDKRIELLENKFNENTTDNNNENDKREIPSQIKKGKNQVLVALRDFWVPTLNKRFDSIESRFDSIESRFDSMESILKK